MFLQELTKKFVSSLLKMKELAFTKTILAWYDQNKRDLPWRNTHDPYVIWISEVILQQTRVGQGLDYFLRFIERFPTVTALARSDEQDVLKVWQGLGYYTRARNLHAAARDIVFNNGGVFPDSYDKLIKLKGIGPYTAAAIASIAFNLPCPVVDGNVLRFFSRYFGISIPIDSSAGRKKIYDKAVLLIDHQRPGTFNQAIMEFGALQCTPGKPDCESCPLKESCLAFLQGKAELLPVKRTLTRQRNRYLHYLVVISEDWQKNKHVYLRKREEKDVWMNLYDFPLIETDHDLTEEELMSSEVTQHILKNKIRLIHKSHLVKHILSHQVIFARFYIFVQTGKRNAKLHYMLIPLEEIHNYPVPRLIEQFIHTKMMGI